MALEQDKLPASPTEALSDKEQEESRLDSRDQEDKLSGIQLHICSWKPDADTKLDAYLKKKCLYGTLGALMPHVVMLQETIWVHQNFLKELRSVKPADKNFCFTEGDWDVWGIQSSREAAIIYNSKKLRVEKDGVSLAVKREWEGLARDVEYVLGAR